MNDVTSYTMLRYRSAWFTIIKRDVTVLRYKDRGIKRGIVKGRACEAHCQESGLKREGERGRYGWVGKRERANESE